MALKKSVLSGIVAFVVATVVARAIGGKRLATGIGLLTGGSVVVSTWLSSNDELSAVEFEGEVSAAE